jgi:hypothetical protein
MFRGVHGAPQEKGQIMMIESGSGRDVDRRFDPSKHPDRPGRPQLTQPTKEYFELAREHFLTLERVSSEAAIELDRALDVVLEELAANGDADLHRIEALGESLVEHNRTVAERSAHIRRRLERRGHLEPSTNLRRRATDVVADNGSVEIEPGRPWAEDQPSEGVIVLVRQLAATGVSDRSIGRVLATMGVDDPDEAVRRALR